MNDQADVYVHFGLLPEWYINGTVVKRESWPDDRTDVGVSHGIGQWTLLGGCYREVAFEDGTRFVIDQSATEVWAVWPEPLTFEDAVVYFLGPVLGLMLRSRGIQCLHASASVLNGYAFAVVGEAGRGKSTTAARFALRGFTILSDDIVALREEGSGFAVLPSYPQIKLWSDSAAALFGSAAAIERISPTHTDWDKRALDLSTKEFTFATDTVPLAAAYVLGPRVASLPAPGVQGLVAREGMSALLANMGGVLFPTIVGRARAFEVAARLASTIPIRSVTLPADLNRVDALCDMIVEDFATIVRTRDQ